MYLKGLNERRGQSIKVLAVRRRRGRKKGKEERENLSGRGGRRRRGGWREGGDNRSVFSHRFTQAIALPILCRRLLSMELLSSVAPPLKILLRFHKKKKEKKSNCVSGVMNADRLLWLHDTEHLSHMPLSLLPSSTNCAAKAGRGLITHRRP